MDNDKGVTKVLVHSAKAIEIIKAIEVEVCIKEVGFKDVDSWCA